LLLERVLGPGHHHVVNGDLPGGSAGRWFASVDLTEAGDSARVVLAETVRMLDALRPMQLDPARCRVKSTGHGWTLPRAVEIHLHHRIDPDAGVDVVVGPDEAIVSWLKTHEHIYATDAAPGRSWTAVVVDATAAVLRGEYEVEVHYRGNRLVRSRVIDTAGTQHHTVGESGTLLSCWLPSLRPRRVERRRLDYGIVR